MNRRNAVIIAVAVLLGLLAVYLANSWFSGVEQRQQRVAAQQRMVRIAVATQDLQFGTALTGDNVRFTNWPADSVPQGAFLENASPKLLTSGDVAIRPIAQGEPILLSRISERAVLSANIPQDMRAVTVPVDAVSGVAGFVTPGDVVDVLLTRQIEGGTGDDKMSAIIMENVPVLAMDLRASEKNTDPKASRTATLQVTPQGAQVLALATQVGRLSLALRNVKDQTVGRRSVVTSRALSGGLLLPVRRIVSTNTTTTSSPPVRTAAAPSASYVPRAMGPSMTVIRGTDAKIQEVQHYGS